MKWALLLAAITALVLSGCNRNKEPEGTVFVSGRIDGDSVEISSKIPGRIVNLAVREGDSVEAGQVVAWLSSPQQEAIRDTQRARIVSSQRIVDQLQRDLTAYDEKIKQAELYTKQAQMEAKRYPPLAKTGAVAV